MQHELPPAFNNSTNIFQGATHCIINHDARLITVNYHCDETGESMRFQIIPAGVGTPVPATALDSDFVRALIEGGSLSVTQHG